MSDKTREQKKREHYERSNLQENARALLEVARNILWVSAGIAVLVLGIFIRVVMLGVVPEP